MGRLDDQRDSETNRFARRLRAIAIVAVLLMAPIACYFATEGTWNVAKQRTDGGWSGGYYMAQAEAIMHGRLNVARSDIISECFDWDGRCYGYFGVTPSVIRIPTLGILRWLDSALTPLHITAAVLLAYWAALALVRRSLVELDGGVTRRFAFYGYFLVSVLALGPGGTLVFLTRPAVYEEAAAWNIAFFLLAVDRVWRWHRTGERRSLTFAILLAILAANARPTAATACGVLGLMTLALVWTSKTAAPRRLAAALCLALLPGLTVAGVFWLKFRTPMPDITLSEQVPEAAHWRDVLARNGNKTQGLVFLPTEVVAYLRPDAWRRRTLWPYFDFPYPQNPVWWLPPLPAGGAYVERHTSLTATMPLSWLLNVCVLGWLAATSWRSRTPAADRLFRGGLMLSALAMTALTVTTVGITNRYLSDFFCISVIGMALAAPLVLPQFSRRPILAGAALLVALTLVAWSIVITLSLNTRLVLM